MGTRCRKLRTRTHPHDDKEQWVARDFHGTIDVESVTHQIDPLQLNSEGE